MNVLGETKLTTLVEIRHPVLFCGVREMINTLCLEGTAMVSVILNQAGYK